MPVKTFLSRVLTSLSLVLILLIGFNWYVDMYGLFRDSGGRTVSIYSDERTSKYLLAHRYVPENFSAYIIGPSLSANLDPSSYPDLGIYNFSMMGANITEQMAVIEKAMESNTPKAIIVCLHPYLTMDHGMKTGMINPKEYWGALGSFSLYKAYGLRFIRFFDLLPSKFPQNQFNEYGNNNYEKLLQVSSVEERIRQELKMPGAVDADIDSIALHELGELVTELNQRKVKVIAYFHPLPFPIFEKYKSELLSYQKVLTSHLQGKATIVNFTDEKYNEFSSDLSNYMDHGHLSAQGQQFVLSELVKTIP